MASFAAGNDAASRAAAAAALWESRNYTYGTSARQLGAAAAAGAAPGPAAASSNSPRGQQRRRNAATSPQHGETELPGPAVALGGGSGSAAAPPPQQRALLWGVPSSPPASGSRKRAASGDAAEAMDEDDPAEAALARTPAAAPPPRCPPNTAPPLGHPPAMTRGGKRTRQLASSPNLVEVGHADDGGQATPRGCARPDAMARCCSAPHLFFQAVDDWLDLLSSRQALRGAGVEEIDGCIAAAADDEAPPPPPAGRLPRNRRLSLDPELEAAAAQHSEDLGLLPTLSEEPLIPAFGGGGRRLSSAHGSPVPMILTLAAAGDGGSPFLAASHIPGLHGQPHLLPAHAGVRGGGAAFPAAPLLDLPDDIPPLIGDADEIVDLVEMFGRRSTDKLAPGLHAVTASALPLLEQLGEGEQEEEGSGGGALSQE